MDRLLLAGLLVVILGVPPTVHLGIFKKIQNVTVAGSVMDLLWFPSRSRKTKQCGSMQIRIVVGLCRHKNMNFWSRICIPNTDPDPGELNQGGSRSTTLVTGTEGYYVELSRF
jgi:hypothetical protein